MRNKNSTNVIAAITGISGPRFGHPTRGTAKYAAPFRPYLLDYFGIDCAELPDGRLMLFEADVAMIVHALDAEDLYPYKKPAMARLFAAFRAALEAVGKQGQGSALDPPENSFPGPI